jgi:GGDEF domain-containing protein
MIQGQRTHDKDTTIAQHAVGQAIEYAAAGNPATLVSADIANLGGLNNLMNNDQAAANVHFRALTDLVQNTLQEFGLYPEGFRTGGDEFAIIVPGADLGTVEAALDEARTRLDAYAEANGFKDVPHPKHPGDPNYTGIGVHLGYTPLMGGMTAKEAFSRADAAMNTSKKGPKDVGREQTQATGRVPGNQGPETVRGRGQETAARPGEESGRSPTPGTQQEVTPPQDAPAPGAQPQVPSDQALSAPIEYKGAQRKKITLEVDGKPEQFNALPYIRDLDSRLSKLAKVVRCLG